MGAILGMLMVVGGLAATKEGLAVDKGKGRMTWEWDMSVAGATECEKVEEVWKAAKKRARLKAAGGKREEEARVNQEDRVRGKEAVREAAVTEGDRVVKEAKACTKGPALVAAAETVVNTIWMVVELKREVANSAAPVEVGGWLDAEGKKRKSIQVVS